ncbi:MAG: RNA polymerase sigma factor [Pseudomonadales bacterium]
MATSSSALTTSPEALLVGLARLGNRGAFAELVRRRQSWIRNLMRRSCGDATLAEDLAQQVFLQAWKDISRLREPQAFAGWLKRLAINVWLQHMRKADLLGDAAALEAEPAASPESMSGAIDLDQALGELPSLQRLCIVLCYHEGWSHAAIAESLSLPLGTVKSHIRRGAMWLRQRLADYETKPQMPEGA